MQTNIYETNYKAYQPYMLLDFTFSFEKDIAHDDICRTIIEIMEGIHMISKIEILMGMMEL